MLRLDGAEHGAVTPVDQAALGPEALLLLPRRAGLHLVGPDLEALQRIRTEGAGQGHVAGVAAAGDEYAADAWRVVARVEGVPTGSTLH